jgi:Cu-processing system ATP-binding protein
MIAVRRLCKRYGRTVALDSVDVDFAAGSVTAVVGPNSAGKTTLLKAILGLVRPDSGSVSIGGQVIGRRPGYRAGIGYMRQLPYFPPHLSAAQLLRMLRDLRPASTADERLLDRLRLRSELDKPLGTVSGGTRQKVNAATAFLFRPDVLILDEPTAGMDPVASRAFKDEVRLARDRGAAVILTSHVVSELQGLADAIVLVVEGRTRFAGTPAELAAATGKDGVEDGLAELLESPV